MIISQKKQKVTGPWDVNRIVLNSLTKENDIDQEREHFWVLGLNGSNVAIYLELAFLGTLNQCRIHPREVFRNAIHRGAGAIITVHNHPGGTLFYSPDDFHTFNRLTAVGDLVGIQILDHVIINHEGGYHSFEKNGKMSSVDQPSK